MNSFFLEVIASFAGGLIAIIRPCIYLILLGFLAFTVGYYSLNIEEKDRMKQTLVASSVLISGIAIAFIITIYPGTAQSFIIYNWEIFLKIGAVFIFLFGLSFAGRKQLDIVKKLLRKEKFAYPSFLFLGLALGFAWGHCLTPSLSFIISKVAASPGFSISGLFLLFVYSVGLAISLTASSFGVSKIIERYAKKQYSSLVVFSGLLLTLIGIVVFIHPLWVNVHKYLTSFANNSYIHKLEQTIVDFLL